MIKVHMISYEDLDNTFEIVLASSSSEHKRLTMCVNPTKFHPIIYRLEKGEDISEPHNLSRAINSYNG